MRIHDEIEEDFPLLNRKNYCVTSSKSPKYNCVAWAVSNIGQYWDSVEGVKGYYWPPGIGRNDKPDEWAEIFIRHGYKLININDTAHEYGVEKIAIFGSDTEAEHVARQLPNGNWSVSLDRVPTSNMQLWRFSKVNCTGK